jgi:hypothetical protein
MHRDFSKKPFSAVTSRGEDGLLRQLITPIQFIIPKVFPSYTGVPIDSVALWDTGATNSVVSRDLVEAHNLEIIDQQKVLGVNTDSIVPVTKVDIILNKKFAFPDWRVTVGELGDKIGFLVGMDIIAHGDFSVTQFLNKHNKPCSIFSFLFPAYGDPVDFVEELNRYNSEKKAKSKNVQARKDYNALLKEKKKKKK